MLRGASYCCCTVTPGHLSACPKACDHSCSVRLIYALHGPNKRATCRLWFLVSLTNSRTCPVVRTERKRRLSVGGPLNSMQATVQQPLELMTRYIKAYVNQIMSYSNSYSTEYSFEAVGWNQGNLLVVPVPQQQQQHPQPPQQPIQAVQTGGPEQRLRAPIPELRNLNHGLTLMGLHSMKHCLP